MKATRQVPLTALLQSAQYLPNLERGIQGWLVNQIEVYKKNESSIDIPTYHYTW